MPRLGPGTMLLTVAVMLLALFVYSAIQSAAQTHRLAQQQRSVEAEVATLRMQLAELEGLQAYLGSDEYVEAVARTRFGLVMPGETAVMADTPPVAPEPRRAGERWWEALFSR